LQFRAFSSHLLQLHPSKFTIFAAIMEISERVSAFIRSNRLFDDEVMLSGSGDASVLVGLSGGCDSVATLYLLRLLGYRVRAIHFNFGIRGAEADRDEHFCRQLCEDWRIPFTSHHFDAPAYAREKKLSLELACRELRYGYWEELHRTDSAVRYVALGHHLNDSVETVLFNLMRGTGLAGLQGISPARDFYRRPLLCLWRDEIQAVLKENHISWVTDSTNLSDDYTRNRIRNRLLPLMTRINPNAARGISVTARNLSNIQFVMDKGLEAIRSRFIEHRKVEDFECETIRFHELLREPDPEATLRSLLHLLYPESRIIPTWIPSMFKAFDNWKHTVFANDGFWSFMDRRAMAGGLTIVPALFHTPVPLDNEPQPWHHQEELPVTDRLRQEIREADRYDFYADSAKVKRPLRFKHWEGGERIAPLGMQGKEKLVSDLFSNAGYTPLQKLSTWLLVDADDRVLWVPGLRVSEVTKVDENTRHVLFISV
jgi:tRNA(Ile)-lysidine synthase